MVLLALVVLLLLLLVLEVGRDWSSCRISSSCCSANISRSLLPLFGTVRFAIWSIIQIRWSLVEARWAQVRVSGEGGVGERPESVGEEEKRGGGEGGSEVRSITADGRIGRLASCR